MRTPSTIHALLLASASFAAAVAHAQAAPSAAEIASAGGAATQPAATQTSAQSGTATAPVALAQNTTPTDEIVVTGRRFSEGARTQQKDAINLVNVQSAEDIAKYPDFNAAEALSRVPGVSISADTGEGRFINIRGLDGNLNGTQFGGVQLLNTQPGGTSFGGGGRAVELDTIPIGAVDQLIVRKTGLPDQEAEGLGGSVDIIPRTAQGIKRPFLEGELGGGYQPLHGHAGVYRASIAAGYRFGPDKAFGIEANASYHEDGRGFDDVEPAYQETGPMINGVQVPGGPSDKLLSGVDLRRYNYNRRRFGFGSELTYDPTPQSHYYIRADDAGYTERVNRQLLNYSGLNADAAGNALVADANGNFVGAFATPQLTLRDEQETHLNFVTAFGGHNDLGKVILDYQGSYTAATYHRDYDYNSAFNPAGGPYALNYNNSTITGLPAITSLGGFNPSDPSQFALGGFRNTTEGAHDREWAGRLEVTVPFHLIGTDEDIKFGGKIRLRDKRDSNHSFSYANLPSTPLTAVLGRGPYTNFYSDQYNIGYSPDYLAIRALIPHQPNLYAPTVRDRLFFKDTENIYAGFFEYEGKIDKFGYLVGVRVENTDGTYRGFAASDRTQTGPLLAGKSNYTDFFPTVQLRYDFNARMIARATYSTGIGRPGFNQLQNGNQVDVGGPSVTVGRPDLKPTTDNAFDVSLEYYLPHSGVLSVTLFDKEFDNYIVSTLRTLTGSQANALYTTAPGAAQFDPAAIVRVTGSENVRKSYARGVEAEYNQKLTFLPAPFDGFGVDGNVTYVDSSILLHTSDGAAAPDIKGHLPGTSKLTWNLAGYYEAHGAAIRLAANWVSPSIFGVGPAQGLDLFQDTKFQVDLTSSYSLTKHVNVYFNARNLFNGPLRYYEGYSKRPGQREFYDQSYEVGARFSF